MVSAYVFGHGRCWKSKEKSINNRFNVIGYIDNKKTGVDNDDIPFIHPEEINIYEDIPIIVVSGRKNFVSMVYQLLDLGISEDRVLFGGNFMPSFDAYELVIHNLQGKYQIKKGKIYISACGQEYYIESTEQYEKTVRQLRKKIDLSCSIVKMWPEPISRSYGLEFGKAIDRHYIEKFLEDNCQYIQGDVVEIEDATYTHRYGSNLKNSIVIHVDGAEGCERMNIETGEGVRENIGDCFICTQTLQYVYDPFATVKNIYTILKPSGTALITLPFLAQYSLGDRSWKDYWRYTPQCLFECLSQCFGEENVKTGSYGNIKTVIGFLYGLNEDSFIEDDYNYQDEVYPLIVWAVCHKY